MITVDLSTEEAEKEIRSRFQQIEDHDRSRAQEKLPPIAQIKEGLRKGFPEYDISGILALPTAKWYTPLYRIYETLPEAGWDAPDDAPKRMAQQALYQLARYESIRDAQEHPVQMDTVGAIESIRRTAKAHLKPLMEALERIDQAYAWKGSPVKATGELPSAEYSDPERWAIVDFYRVKVGRDRSKWEAAPSFTLFVEESPTVDDVLEGGDEDFFRDAAEQADYFTLINEIRHPGACSRAGKILRLYTARPVSDRARFSEADHVPANLFLSSSIDDAEGIALDFGNRDVWKMRLNSKALVNTMSTPAVKHYQISDPSGAYLDQAPELVIRWEDLKR